MKLKGKCDICRKHDGFWGHNLQKCQTCGVLVHELCYGMPETRSKDFSFVCHACKAVGVEVEVNVPSIVGGVLVVDDEEANAASTTTTTTASTGSTTSRSRLVDREWIKQESRPTVCVLCSHDKGIHAMHPLLDVHGPEGRQLTWNGRKEIMMSAAHHHHLPAQQARKPAVSVPPSTSSSETTRQLAWVHTLCASVICSNARTRGCVYGCDKNGNFYYDDDEDEEEQEDEEDDEDDDEEEEFEELSFKSNHQDESTNHSSTSNLNKEDGNCSRVSNTSSSDHDTNDIISTVYYAIAAEGVYAKCISSHRKLKCFICGKKDDTWRIPLQCTAGDEMEYGPFQERHPRGTEQCTVAVHVGCAHWGCAEPEGSHLERIDGKRCNLCFFTPGRDGDDDDDDVKHGDGTKDGTKEDCEAENDSDGTPTVMEAVTSPPVALCYCTAHARDIVMNSPRQTRKRKATKTSVARNHVERLPVFPKDRKDRGLTRKEIKFASNNISDSRRQLINRASKF